MLHLHHTFQLSISKRFKNHYYFYYLFVESQQSTQHWEVQAKPQSYGLSYTTLNQRSSFPSWCASKKSEGGWSCVCVCVCVCVCAYLGGKREKGNLSELPC